MEQSSAFDKVALPHAQQHCADQHPSASGTSAAHLNVLERRRAKSPGRGGPAAAPPAPPWPPPRMAPMDMLWARGRGLMRCWGDAAGGEAPRSEEAPQEDPAAPTPAEVATYGVPLSVSPRPPAR